MQRAKTWTADVEDAFRLQEAGYRSLQEMRSLGLPEPERWPESGFIRKLPTRRSFEAGSRVLIYFRRSPECEAKDLHRVKLYTYAS